MEKEFLIKFVHESEIKSINEQLPLYLKQSMEDKDRHCDSVSIKQVSAPYISVSQDNEEFVSKYRIKFNEVKLSLTYIENTASGEMIIKIGKEIIGPIKNMKGLSKTISREILDTTVKEIYSRI